MKALFDVNVLIALLDCDHVHHTAATEWRDKHIDHGWASCPITQNGCLRIMSQPRYPNSLPVHAIIERLCGATSTTYHSFISDNLSLLDSSLIEHTRLLSPSQLTDVYLLALATENACRFVTFDQAVPAAAAKVSRRENLVVI